MDIRFYFVSLFLSAILIMGSGCASHEQAVEAGIEAGVLTALGLPNGADSTQQTSQSSTQTSPAPAPGSAGWSQYMISHARLAFSHTFAPGGIWLNHGKYDPGEWTRYKFHGLQDQDVVTVERALLKVRGDGQEWWRVEWATPDQTWIYEGLIDPENQELLRLRARGPQGKTSEVPVEKGTRVFQSPRELTEESIRGATVGSESVTVGGQSYSARHVEYGGAMNGGTIDWWINETVPGELVKYQIRNNTSDVVWTSELVDQGTGATTKLNTF